MTNAIITADEAREQGDTPWILLNIARFNERKAKEEKSESHAQVAVAVRRVEVELGDLLGIKLRRQGGAPANDNRRDRRPQYKRAAPLSLRKRGSDGPAPRRKDVRLPWSPIGWPR